MRGRNQKITSFFLLAIILAPLSYMFILQSRQQQIRHRMKEELEHSILKISATAKMAMPISPGFLIRKKPSWFIK